MSPRVVFRLFDEGVAVVNIKLEKEITRIVFMTAFKEWIEALYTGRWKIINTNGNSELYLECATKYDEEPRWVGESGLRITETEEFINECQGGCDEIPTM